MMLSSQRDSVELHPHHPDTCLVINEQNVLGYSEIAWSYPDHQVESKCIDKTICFSWKIFLAAKRPQYSSSSKQSDPIAFFFPIVIHICLFGNVPSINSSEHKADLSAFFARLSTFMLICSFKVQSCYFFVSLVCDCTYLSLMGKGWTATRCLIARRISACVWLVGSARRGVVPWETTPLLSQSTTTGGMVPCYSEAAAFRINCVIRPSSISPQ
jgi:hypothetical protein